MNFTNAEVNKEFLNSPEPMAERYNQKEIENTNIKIEEDIIKQAKKVSITIDQDVWENFSTLATNISQKKGPLLTEILKEYLLKHRDLY